MAPLTSDSGMYVSPDSTKSDIQGTPALDIHELSYAYGGGLSDRFGGTGAPNLSNVTCQFPRGVRVLVAGANGSGKSTLLSIAAGKRMVPRDACRVLGRPAFHDSSLSADVMYCGDWWRTDFFFNISVTELIGEEALSTERCQELVEILQVDLNWRINALSDGQRRRCQLLECLLKERAVYIMDEITTDLDLFARENLLAFLKKESEVKGSTIFYATHIFDQLADWATHIMYFSHGKLERCCEMRELTEYHDLVKEGARVPLYDLMKRWIFKQYAVPPVPEASTDAVSQVSADCEDPEGERLVLDVKSLSYSYVPGGALQLRDLTFSFNKGARILVVGANGAGKSSIMSILGGKRMIPRGFASILGKDCFNDPSLASDVVYCGDWWRTNFFMNMPVRDLVKQYADTARCKYLVQVLQIDLNWLINELSDGQRRRCQLLECLVAPRPVYLMDEITSDLDLYAREGLLNFLKFECEYRGATIFYCTHIFDHLEGWATHLLHLSHGSVVRSCEIEDVEEYARLLKEGVRSPLYTLVRRWVYAEYEEMEANPKKARTSPSFDGRLPNLGLAGPTQLRSG